MKKLFFVFVLFFCLSLLANISSQFISSILLISPVFPDGLSLVLQNDIVSGTYIDLTIKVMSDFGVKVDRDKNIIYISKNQMYKNMDNYDIEPDYSSLSYFWALGAINRSFVSTDYFPNGSFQSDYNFVEIINKMGSEVSIHSNKIEIRFKKLHGLEVDLKNMPDQVPTFAVLALLADSPTCIRNISHLKFKETDRISALISEISKIGGIIRYKNGNLNIKPLTSKYKNVIVNTYSDHRLAMAFSILQKVFPQIEIDSLQSIKKSNPDFSLQLAIIN